MTVLFQCQTHQVNCHPQQNRITKVVVGFSVSGSNKINYLEMTFASLVAGKLTFFGRHLVGWAKEIQGTVYIHEVVINSAVRFLYFTILGIASVIKYYGSS